MSLDVSGKRAVETLVLLAVIFSSTPLASQTSSDVATEEVEDAATAPSTLA